MDLITDDDFNALRPIATRKGWELTAVPHADGSAGGAVAVSVHSGSVAIGLALDGGAIEILLAGYHGEAVVLATLAQVRDIAAQLVAVADLIESKGG